jgi:hypothetical protein
MKPLLMHPDRDFEIPQDGDRPGDDALVRDLDLEALFGAMAQGDEVLAEIARVALQSGESDPAVIRYRQDVLADCLRHPDVIRELHGLAAAAIGGWERNHLFFLGYSATSVLSTSVRALKLYLPILRRLRHIAGHAEGEFRSTGLRRFLRTLTEALPEDYLHTLQDHAGRLRFADGMLLSARLGSGNVGTGYTLRRSRRRGWWSRSASRIRWVRARTSFTVPLRDDGARRGLARIRGRGVERAAYAVAGANDTIIGLFRGMRAELGFYVGCLNLHDRLSAAGLPTCIPEPVARSGCELSAGGIYDLCLALRLGKRLVGNDVDADGTRLVMITGANSGGKSTFLRSIGLAQLMMRCGMFVAADSFRASVATGVFTHFTREEDPDTAHGKLDEELRRMRAITDRIHPGGVLLCNESFSSTNEREGSEIAHGLVRAVTESGVQVFYVTHLYELAQRWHDERRGDTLFLRAERRADGTRTYRMLAAEPLPTSFGRDLYLEVFGGDGGPSAAPDPDAPA